MRSRGGGAEASGVMTMKKQYITIRGNIALWVLKWGTRKLVEILVRSGVPLLKQKYVSH